MAYFFIAIPSGIILKKFGYKKGIITGLLIKQPVRLCVNNLHYG